MCKDFRVWMFIAVAFLLGSINVLYHSLLYAFLVVALGVNVGMDRKGFIKNVKKYWKYLILPLAGVVYLIVHYAIVRLLGGMPYKVSGSAIELLLLYFGLIPIYVLSAKSFLTPRRLQQFLLSLCWGIVAFNVVKMFYLTGEKLFVHPFAAFQELNQGRFGGNMSLLKGFVLLEAQALYLAVAGVIAYFFILQGIVAKKWGKTQWYGFVIFVLALLFLSFTLTKGSILAFLLSGLFLSMVALRKMSFKGKLFWGGVGIFMLLLGYYKMPEALKGRAVDMKIEIERVQQGDYHGGSVSPRLALWKENFEHFQEWGAFGLGLYKKFGVRQWYQSSRYSDISSLRNTHNSFLDFWLLGGVLGLCFIGYYFLAPIMAMWRRKQYAYLAIALLIVLFIANNTCLLIALNDSCPLILFLFALSFFYWEEFKALEYRERVSEMTQI